MGLRTCPWLLGALALAACSDEPAQAPRTPGAPVRKSLVVAQAEPWPDIVVAYGSLAPAERVRLAFLRPGRIAALGVDLGSRVAQDEVIARLDRTRLLLEVREAEAAVRQARVRLELPPEGEDDAVDAEKSALVQQARAVLAEATQIRDRARDLVAQNLSPQSELDTAVATFAVAESRVQQALNDVRDRCAILAQRRAELALARESLREADLHAPFPGVVAERLVDVHDYIGAGQPVMTLLRVDPLRLRVQVPERDAARIEVGQIVRFAVDGDEGGLAGSIVRISPEIRPDNRTLTVEAEVPNPEARLRSGRFVRASVEVSAPKPRTTVPFECVVSFAGVSRVFLVVDGKAHSRQVETGRITGDRIEIESGVAPGEALIRLPEGLIDGQPIEVEGNAAGPGSDGTAEDRVPR